MPFKNKLIIALLVVAALWVGVLVIRKLTEDPEGAIVRNKDGSYDVALPEGIVGEYHTGIYAALGQTVRITSKRPYLWGCEVLHAPELKDGVFTVEVKLLTNEAFRNDPTTIFILHQNCEVTLSNHAIGVSGANVIHVEVK